MSNRHLRWVPLALAAIVFVAAVRVAATQPQTSSSGQSAKTRVSDGVYSAAQATRGHAAYSESCSVCHLEDLSGTGEAPALVGTSFVSGWENMSVGDLFDRIQRSMPQSNPNSLTPETTGDIVAYILQANEFPAGSDDLKNGEALKRIMIQKK